MKKSLSIIAVLFCLTVSAQKIDTVKAAMQIQPIVTNAIAKDTAYQVSWQANSITRDTSAPVIFSIVFYSRKGVRVSDINLNIPANIIQQWGTSDTIIDDYILAKYGLKRR
jgi:hypothetical protein